MIAGDTSSLVAYLSGAHGSDVDSVDAALADNQLCLPPVVLTELLSDPRLPESVTNVLRQIPLFPLKDGFWERAGALRSQVIGRKRSAPLADALIAQTCLDHDVVLITRDEDFRAFAQVSELKLIT